MNNRIGMNLELEGILSRCQGRVDMVLKRQCNGFPLLPQQMLAKGGVRMTDCLPYGIYDLVLVE